jgi:type IV pilus assembly protein PilK
MTTAERSQPAYWNGLERLPDMDEAQFDRWVGLLRERTGMFMPKERKSFLVTSVGIRMRELGYEDYQSYYEYLTSGLAGNIEWTALVDRLTVHETRFFRDPRALQFVQEECLPKMVERVRRREHVQVWSAGCSTGEEAFTLAMLLDHGFTQAGLQSLFGVIGTDISLYSLATAKQGVYPDRRYKHIPPELRERFTERLPEMGNGFRVSDRLRRRVCFAQFNILDVSCTPPGSMDLVYCQNVLIYFDRETRAKILDGLVRPLRPGGTLVLGAGEMIGWDHPLMERAGVSEVLAYRRVKQ